MNAMTNRLIYSFDILLPRQPLGPPLNAKKLNLCRFVSFSGLKFSGLNVSGSGYSCGQRCVTYGDTNTLEPFGSSKFAVKKKSNELKSTKKCIYSICNDTQTLFHRTRFIQHSNNNAIMFLSTLSKKKKNK